MNSYSQSVEDFKKLMSVFNQGADTKIPNALSKTFFNFIPNTDPNFGNKSLHVKQIVFKNEENIGLSAYSDCGAGGICESADLYVFSDDGQKIDSLINFEFHFGDCGHNHIQYCSFISDSLLIVINQNTNEDCMKDTIYSNLIKMEFIRINENGKFSKRTKKTINEKRPYYNLSTDLLINTDLIDKSKNELSIMRNEIYAAHGYKFKSRKWKDFFSNTSWYEPLFDNVDQLITPIERLNIEMIIKYENK